MACLFFLRPRLEFRFDGREIEDIFPIEVVVWNAGNVYIASDDFSDGEFKIIPLAPITVLYVRQVRSSRDTLSFRSRIIATGPTDNVLLGLDGREALEPGDGGRVSDQKHTRETTLHTSWWLLETSASKEVSTPVSGGHLLETQKLIRSWHCVYLFVASEFGRFFLSRSGTKFRLRFGLLGRQHASSPELGLGFITLASGWAIWLGCQINLSREGGFMAQRFSGISHLHAGAGAAISIALNGRKRPGCSFAATASDRR